MPIEVKCMCGRTAKVAEEHAGKRAKCAGCGATIQIPAIVPATEFLSPDELASIGLDAGIATPDQLAAAHFDPFDDVKAPKAPSVTTAPVSKPKKQYKVLSQKDKWFSGKFDPEKLEQAMNAYADQGWEVKAAVTASIAGFGGNREELVIILER